MECEFCGVGSNSNVTLKEFEAEIIVDEHSYPGCIRVVSHTDAGINGFFEYRRSILKLEKILLAPVTRIFARY